MSNNKNQAKNGAVFLTVQRMSFGKLKRMQNKTLERIRGDLIKEVREAARALHWVDSIITLKQEKYERENTMSYKLTKEQQSYIEARLSSASLTLHRLPHDGVQGYISTWPDIQGVFSEIDNTEKQKLKVRPKQKDITEMEEVIFEWMKWLEPYERKLIWRRTEGVRWKAICAELACERTHAWKMYKRALGKIGAKL